MVDVMPIMVAPKLRKEKLIGQLVDFARSSGLLVDVCTSAVKALKLSKDFLHMTLLQYDPTGDERRTKKEMVEHFAKLNMPEVDGNFRDDGPC